MYMQVLSYPHILPLTRKFLNASLTLSLTAATVASWRSSPRGASRSPHTKVRECYVGLYEGRPQRIHGCTNLVYLHLSNWLAQLSSRKDAHRLVLSHRCIVYMPKIQQRFGERFCHCYIKDVHVRVSLRWNNRLSILTKLHNLSNRMRLVSSSQRSAGSTIGFGDHGRFQFLSSTVHRSLLGYHSTN